MGSMQWQSGGRKIKGKGIKGGEEGPLYPLMDQSERGFLSHAMQERGALYSRAGEG